MNEKLLKAHGRCVRSHGKFFRIIAHRLGNCVLAQEEEVGTNALVDLVKGRSALVRDLRDSINRGLVS